MKNLITYRNIWKVAFPIMLSSVAQNVVNVTDTAFLGQLSEVALGAAGNAGIFYFLLTITGMGITIGSQIIIGRRNGEKKYHMIGRILEHDLYFMVPVGVTIILLVNYFGDNFLQSITRSPDIVNAATDFLHYRIYGIVFAYINFSFIAFFVGITNTKVLTFATTLMMIVNVFLDYSLIFGNFGFPEMGIEGAAIASVISEMCSVAFFLVYTFLTVDRKKYYLFQFSKPDPGVLKRILKVGSPIMLQNFLSLSSWFIFFMIIEKIGETELAISHIIRSIYMALMIPLFGFSNATNTLVSNLIGQGNAHLVMKLIWKAMVLATGCTIIVLGFNILLSEQIVNVFTHNPVLITGALETLTIINFTMFFFCGSFILFNGVTGTGNTRTSLLIEFMTISIYLAGTYYIALEIKASLPVVWCSEFIYFSLLGSLSFIYLKWGNWKNKEI